VDRRIGRIAALLALAAAGCGGREPETRAVVDGSAAGGPHPAPLDGGARSEAAARSRVSIDAAREIDATPIGAGDVLSGAQAEQAIATQTTPGIDAGSPTEPTSWQIGSTGVGPFRLSGTRADVLRHVPARYVRRLPTKAGAPTVELATAVLDGAPVLRLRLLAARVVEIEVVWRDRRIATDGEVMVGSTFQDAIDEHGEPIRVRQVGGGSANGWMMSELPGVVFVPADPTVLAQPEPPPAARIGRIVVLGPESLTAPD
jgi:hypothetical protein